MKTYKQFITEESIFKNHYVKEFLNGVSSFNVKEFTDSIISKWKKEKKEYEEWKKEYKEVFKDPERRKVFMKSKRTKRLLAITLLIASILGFSAIAVFRAYTSPINLDGSLDFAQVESDLENIWKTDMFSRMKDMSPEEQSRWMSSYIGYMGIRGDGYSVLGDNLRKRREQRKKDGLV